MQKDHQNGVLDSKLAPAWSFRPKADHQNGAFSSKRAPGWRFGDTASPKPILVVDSGSKLHSGGRFWVQNSILVVDSGSKTLFWWSILGPKLHSGGRFGVRFLAGVGRPESGNWNSNSNSNSNSNQKCKVQRPEICGSEARNRPGDPHPGARLGFKTTSCCSLFDSKLHSGGRL